MEVEHVEHILSLFFQGLNANDGATIRRLWHPDARLFLNNAVLNTQTLPFLLNLPDSIDFAIEEIRCIDVDRATATARVDYSMPVGRHSGLFGLVKANGQWVIASWLDHG
ncbi:MAG: nuclear transport factor 2 family protein [Anaerolineae bacterium]|jgi:hypothetical protein